MPAVRERIRLRRHYRDPFRGVHGLRALRIDMGVDYSATADSPVFAIGRGRVVRLDTNATWPGGHIVVVELHEGPAKGKRYYLAEHLTFPKHLREGDHVDARTRIATLHPGYPYCETGWCADGQTYPLAYGCYKEGERTGAGDNFSKFLHLLGTPKGLTEGRNTTCPLPRAWPRW